MATVLYFGMVRSLSMNGANKIVAGAC